MYEQLRQEGHVRELLNLPDQFHADLVAYLQAHPSLLWLMQAKTSAWPQCAQTLSGLVAAGGSFQDTRLLASLGKVSAHAAGDADAQAGASQALTLLDYQVGRWWAEG